MDKETREQLIDECIKALQQANKVLNKNIREIQDASRDLQEMQKLLEEWGSDHLRRNEDLLIDFDNIVPPDLTEQIRNSMQTLRAFKDNFFHHKNLIEKEFQRLSSIKQDQIHRLKPPNRE